MTASPDARPPPLVKDIGHTTHGDAVARMRAFTTARQPDTRDEIWLTGHDPVFTLGLAGRPEHVRAGGAIPVERTDRGGQVTYHGPGQVVAYVLVDLRRAGGGIRRLVLAIEDALLATLAGHGVTGHRVAGRPGVYVADAKIGAVGLRVSQGCTYHGCSLNVDCDLAPFANIDTCGYADLADTSLAQLGVAATPAAVARVLGAELAARL